MNEYAPVWILIIILVIACLSYSGKSKGDGVYIDLGMTTPGNLFKADEDYESEEELGTILNFRYMWEFGEDSLSCGLFHNSQLFYGYPIDKRKNEFSRTKAGCYVSWRIGK